MLPFEPLQLPPAKLTLERKGNQLTVWCVVRRKKLILTPEEWVRQHVIHFLLHHQQIPLAKIASEVSLEINGLIRRCDVLIYDNQFKPWMLIECKTTEIKLNENTVYQIAQYNSQLQVENLWITNGLDHHLLQVNQSNGHIQLLEDFPIYR